MSPERPKNPDDYTTFIDIYEAVSEVDTSGRRDVRSDEDSLRVYNELHSDFVSGRNYTQLQFFRLKLQVNNDLQVISDFRAEIQGLSDADLR